MSRRRRYFDSLPAGRSTAAIHHRTVIRGYNTCRLTVGYQLLWENNFFYKFTGRRRFRHDHESIAICCRNISGFTIEDEWLQLTELPTKYCVIKMSPLKYREAKISLAPSYTNNTTYYSYYKINLLKLKW